MNELKNFLFENSDKQYAKFQSKIVSTVQSESIIGVRTPILRKKAKEMFKSGEYTDFLSQLPHKYFEENQIHAFIINEIKDFDTCIAYLNEFLPFIDNWATCDQTSPKIFAKNKDKLIQYIIYWLDSGKTYTVRFAIEMLMNLYLDEDFKPDYLFLVASYRCEVYYIRMMIAWYMATALYKQWDFAITVLQDNLLDEWTHNKTIQKARESFRITDEQKELLNGLKR